LAENRLLQTALQQDLELLHDTVRDAGEIALGYFRGENRVWMKAGNSPVSEADIAVDRHLRETLTAARPDYGWLSEETAAEASGIVQDSFFVVDPIDGTRGFVEGNPHWCICAAIVRGGRPVVGIVHCPALGRTFAASAGGGAVLNGMPIVPDTSANILRLTGSRRLNEELNRLFPGRFTILPYVPSLAYRLVLVATGEIDGAFARSGSHDWDLAAAEVVLSEAGGTMTSERGEMLVYNGTHSRNPALVAAGPGRHAALLGLAKTGGFLH
jgi:myo-inositol-1(or 4)-monophosphatase